MKYFKFVLILFALMLTMMSGYSATINLTSNLQNFYSFNTDYTDEVGSNDITNYGGSLVSGKISNAVEYSGASNDHGNFTSFPLPSAANYTMALWVKSDDATNANEFLYGVQQNVGANIVSLNFDSSGRLKATHRTNNGVEITATTTTDYMDGTYHLVFVTWIYENRTLNIYVDGSSNSVASGNNGGADSLSITKELVLGAYNDKGIISTTTDFTGQIDALGIYTRVLNATDFINYYNSGIGLEYPFSLTPIIQVNVTDNQYMTASPINVSMTTLSDVNMSIYINGILNQSFTETNFTTALIELSEGGNNLSFRAVDVNGFTENNLTVYLDTIQPHLSVSNFTEINSYYVNFSRLMNYSDTNLDTCLVTTNGESFSCTNESYLYSITGNHTFNVSVNDSAGYVNNSLNNIVFLNPYQRFHIANNGTLLSSFTFGGTLFSGTEANFTTYNSVLSLGSNTLEFSKSGYGTQNFTFQLTNTSSLNITFNVSLATINVFIKDQATLQTISGPIFNLDFIGPVGFNTSTSTGLATIPGLLSLGDYTMVTTSSLYNTENTFFSFNNQEILNLTIYVYNSTAANSGYVVIEVLDGDGAPIQDVVVQAKQWISSQSAYIAVSEGKTAQDGKDELNIILDDEIYKFTATKNSVTTTTVEQIISTANNGKTITLTLIIDTSSVPSFKFENVIADATESFNTTTNTSSITFNWTNTDGIDIIGCVNAYRIQNYKETRIQTNCTTSDSATLIKAYTLDLSSYDYVLRAEFSSNGDYFPVKSFRHYKVGNIFAILAEYGIHLYLLIVLNILSIYAGIKLENFALGTGGLIISSILAIVIAPTIITTGVASFLLFVGVITLYGGTR